MKISVIQSRLKKLITDCKTTIINRENLFSSRSESWQDSEKGEKYQENTEALNDALSLLIEAHDDYFDHKSQIENLSK